MAEAVSSAMAARNTTNAQVLLLEQLGDSTLAAVTTVGNSHDSEDMLTAQSFAGIFDTLPTSLTQSGILSSFGLPLLPTVSSVLSGFSRPLGNEKATPALHQPFILGPGCRPFPVKLVTQI